MPPFWPFKKKQEGTQVYEAPPAPTVYRRGEDPHVRPSVPSDVAAYKDALALFGGGSDEVNAATDQSVLYDGATGETTASPKTSPAEVVASPSTHTWVHHTDGYHYKRMEDGSFDSTPHTKREDGTYTPYS